MQDLINQQILLFLARLGHPREEDTLLKEPMKRTAKPGIDQGSGKRLKLDP
ncbi:MAG: hypothetical protein U9R17_12250 [Thermodesulfobacteriota bacterium]|nr:hypothetical protein [Thermodesulfobacteriota bacterium]